MDSDIDSLKFAQLHIDVARNACDDFNPFHDPQRWKNVARNPFSGPIVLGFQLECLIADRVQRYRIESGESGLLEELGLNYSCYDLRFVGAVHAGQAIRIEVGPAKVKRGEQVTLSNRVRLFADDALAVSGYKREANQPLYAQDERFTGLSAAADRQFLAGQPWYLKRKFLTTSNAKNFLCASLVPQHLYIDELAEKVDFPEMFPCALVSSALLERAWGEGHNFEREPLIYQSHRFSVDRKVAATMRSNDRLHIVSRAASSSANRRTYECHSILGDDRPLFRGTIDLRPL